MWQAVKDTLSLLSVKFGGNQRQPTWGTITAQTQGELDLKGDEETGDQDNSGKVWRWQEDDWGKRGLCRGAGGGERGGGGAWAGAGVPGSPESPAGGLPDSWHRPLQWADRPLRSLLSFDPK